MTGDEVDARVLRNDERHRYELWLDGDLAGLVAYREPDGAGSGQTIFTHTEIDAAYSGRGLGYRLVREALDDAVRRGREIVPLCPFVGKYLRSTSGYDEFVRWPKETG